jgi:Na+/proline symporter
MICCFVSLSLCFFVNYSILIGFGLGVALAIGFSFLLGILSYFFVKGEAENYFVAGKSLPLWIVAMTLGAQSVDSNTLLGNVDLSYRGHVRLLLSVRSFVRWFLVWFLCDATSGK